MAVDVVAETPSDGVVVLRIAGRLEAASAPDFEAALLPHAENAAVSRIVLDGSGLEYVASAGLRALLKAVKAMTPRKAKLYAACLNPAVVSVLKMTGFQLYIDIRPAVDDCMA